MASNSKAMLRQAGKPFFAWGDPLKLGRFYGTVHQEVLSFRAKSTVRT